MTGHIIDEVFGWAPLTAFVILLVIAWTTIGRRGGHAGHPVGKSYACAGCGRRGKHEHMVPATSGGAVVWYCASCSQRR